MRTKKRRTEATEPFEPTALEETLAVLGEGDRPLSVSVLVGLSGLRPEEVFLFEKVWAEVGVERRRQVVTRLVEVAEENFALNFENVFKSCLKDEDAGVRRQAIEGLWESEDAALIAPLLNILVQDSSAEVQAAAATGLGKFTMLAELKKLRLEYASELTSNLMAVFSDVDRPVAVRRRALEAVAPLSLPDVTRAINQAYRSGNPKLRASAVYAMGKNCDISWLPQLIEELDSTEDEVRYEAAGACGELGEEDAVPYLIKLTNDTDADVQRAAIQALGRIGGKEAQEHLERCLDHPSQAIREAAEVALDELEAAENPLSFRRLI